MVLPLQGRQDDLYKTVSDIKVPSDAKLKVFRDLVCGAVVGDAKVTEAVGKVGHSEY